MKKLTFLLLHLGYGGIETATINTVNALSNEYDVEIVSFYNLKNNQENRINKKVKIKYLYNGEPNKKEFLLALKNKKIFSILKEGIKSINILKNKKLFLKKEIKNSSADVIISTRYEFSTILSKYGKSETLKIAQEHHHHNNDKKYIKILSTKYYNIDYLFALTEGLKKDYEKFLLKNKHTKIVVVPNMLVDLPVKKSNLISNNLITISRLDYGKRNNELINIVSNLKIDFKLYIIGDGEEYANLQNQINELNLSDKVILTGYKNKAEIEKYMLKSSIFLMASVSEGLPMVLLEAMSYGLPCIAYETDSGVCDIIENEKNGYVIKNRDEKNYIKLLENLMCSNDLKKTFSKEAVKKSEQFYKDKIIKIWKKII